MLCCLFGNIFLQIAIGYRSFISERLVELNNKVIFKVFGNSTAVASCITDNLVFFRNNLNIRSLIKGIHYNIRMIVFRKSETEKKRGTKC